MTRPAEITSAQDWDRLVNGLKQLNKDIDGLYQRITDPGDPDAEPEGAERERPTADPETFPYRGYDLDAGDRDAEREDARETRADFESDGRLDGDYDPDPADADSPEAADEPPVANQTRPPGGLAYEGAETETETDADFAESYGEYLQDRYQDRMEELDAAGALDPPDDDPSSDPTYDPDLEP